MKRKDDRSQRLKTAADYTQAAFLCPVCEERVLSTKAEAHLACRHPTLGKSKFLELVKRALQEGRVRFELSGRHDPAINPTKRFAEANMLTKGRVRAILRG